MEAMMGLPETVSIKSLPVISRAPQGSINAKIKLISKCLYYFFRAQKIVSRFQTYFALNYKTYSLKKNFQAIWQG